MEQGYKGGDKAAQRQLIDRHGGIIALLAKRQYQRGKSKGYGL